MMLCSFSGFDHSLILNLITTSCAVVSVLVSVYLYNNNRGLIRQQHRWDEYRDTIYGPLSTALANVEKIALSVQSTAQELGATAGDEIKARLAFALNEVELTCVKASGHPDTFLNDWREAADTMVPQILETLDELDVSSLGEAQRLTDSLQEFCQFFLQRLRQQRRRMLGLS